jgi:hypothetical protein
MPTIPKVRVYLRPLGPAETTWCDEHALPCKLVQSFVLEGRVGTSESEPLMVITHEDHE